LTLVTKKKRLLSKKKFKITKNNENIFSNIIKQALQALKKESLSKLNVCRTFLVLKLIVAFVVAFYLAKLSLLIFKEFLKQVTITQRIAFNYKIYYIIIELD